MTSSDRSTQPIEERHIEALRAWSSHYASLTDELQRELVALKWIAEESGRLVITPLGQFYLQRDDFNREVDAFLSRPRSEWAAGFVAYRQWLKGPEFRRQIDTYLAQIDDYLSQRNKVG